MQRGCGGFSLPEIHILDPKGGGLRNVLKCTFWHPTKPASRLKVTVAAEIYSWAPVEDMCYVLG